MPTENNLKFHSFNWDDLKLETHFSWNCVFQIFLPRISKITLPNTLKFVGYTQQMWTHKTNKDKWKIFKISISKKQKPIKSQKSKQFLKCLAKVPFSDNSICVFGLSDEKTSIFFVSFKLISCNHREIGSPFFWAAT